jgi:O-antigen/teichoic acid export membrane protein
MDTIDVKYVLVVAATVQSIGALYVFIGLHQAFGMSADALNQSLLRDFLLAGLKQHFGTVSLFAYTRLNQLFVFHWFGERETGLFAAAHTLAFGCFALFSSVQTALYYHVTRERTDGLGVTVSMLRIALYSGLVMLIPAGLAAELLLQMYGGEQFVEAATSFRLLLFASWLLSVAGMAAPYYVKAGAFSLASANSVVVALIGLALNFWLVPRFGATGASLATLATLALAFFGVILMIRAISGVWPWAVFMPRFAAERARMAQWWQSVRL